MSRKQIKSAIKLLNNQSNWYRCSFYVQQLTRSLAVYQSRGEFDGSIESAIECLERAGYERSKGRAS